MTSSDTEILEGKAMGMQLIASLRSSRPKTPGVLDFSSSST